MLLVPLTNKLVYPARPPGFDPTHIAAQGMSARHGFSVIPAGNNFINLLTGQKGAITGTAANIVQNMHGIIGPNLGYIAANNNNVNFAGGSTATDSLMTFAAIFYATTVAGWGALGSNGTSSNTCTFGFNASGQLNFKYILSTNTLTATTVVVATNTPYFVIGSASLLAVNFLLLNLNTGKVLTSTVTGVNTTGASNGTFSPNSNTGQGSYAGTQNQATGMFSPCFLSIPQMRQWAADPWSFWYPRTTENIIQIALAAAHGGAYANTYTQLITAAMASQKTVGKILSN